VLELEVLLAAGVGVVVGELDEPQAVTIDRQRRAMAPTAGRKRGELTARPSLLPSVRTLEREEAA